MMQLLKRQRLGKLKVWDVVAICDHLCVFFLRELKQEVAGEAVPIAFDLHIEPLSRTPYSASRSTSSMTRRPRITWILLLMRGNISVLCRSLTIIPLQHPPRLVSRSLGQSEDLRNQNIYA